MTFKKLRKADCQYLNMDSNGAEYFQRKHFKVLIYGCPDM